MKDPCIERTKRHLFDSIVFIVIASVIRGGDSWEDTEKSKEWLSSFLELPNGIPSYDTFYRFFSHKMQ